MAVDMYGTGSKMGETNKLLPPPLDWTDPYVIHDNRFRKSSIVKTYEPQDNMGESHDLREEENLRIDGILAPIIKLNNRVIEKEHIERFVLYYNGFMPSIEILVNDENDNIKFSDVPGLNNVITFIIIPTIDGAYKKITLDFYIKDCKFMEGSMVWYYGEYKFLPFEEVINKQVTFRIPSGCIGQNTVKNIAGELEASVWFCNLPPNTKPCTFEFLHEIAEMTGLGYATTDQCKEIRDDKFRLLLSEKYKDAIPKHVAFAGLDKTSIFDTWIDLFGYLTLVNVYWVMNSDIDIHHLSIKACTGTHNTDAKTSEPNWYLIERTLTNYNKMTSVNNMMIESYEHIVDFEYTHDEGTLNTYNLWDPNVLANQTKQIQIVENSVDGRRDPDEYNFGKTRFIGFEMAGHATPGPPILYQQRLHDTYFRKLRSRQLKVRLQDTNFGLMRGSLVNVILFEYNPKHKDEMLTGQSEGPMGEFNDEQKLERIEPMDDKTRSNYALDDEIGVPNVSLNGLYYIDSMEFVYNNGDDKMIQYLYLIKKGSISNMYNRYTSKRTMNPLPPDGITGIKVYPYHYVNYNEEHYNIPKGGTSGGENP